MISRSLSINRDAALHIGERCTVTAVNRKTHLRKNFCTLINALLAFAVNLYHKSFSPVHVPIDGKPNHKSPDSSVSSLKEELWNGDGSWQ